MNIADNHLWQALSAFNNWVVCKEDKVPLRAIDGLPASPINPADWCDYATAADVASKVGCGIGFVLSDDDPFTCIDLDTYKVDAAPLSDEDKLKIKQNHAEIFRSFDTYTEYSPSGRGAHIWCKGDVDGRKFDKQFLEVYSVGRYMTVTFNDVVNVPLAERQELLDELIASIDEAQPRHDNVGAQVNGPQVRSDEEVKAAAFNESTTLFTELWEGRWQGLYPSQSEADLTLCNLIANHTDSQEQVARMYWSSPLFLTSPKRRRKAKRDYLFADKYGIVKKSFDQKTAIVPTVATQTIEAEGEALPSEESQAPVAAFSKPPGLLGDIAEYIYCSSVVPNLEVALAGALTFMAGICGRSFNTVTGTGLNQYVVLLAQTGQGKEAAARGISRLYKAVLPMAPAIQSYAGPSEIASAQALLKFFAESNCFWSHKNEFGFWLQKMNHKYAKPNELTLKGMLLDLFHKSGHDDILMGSIYSDKKNNAPMVKAPALTLYGESTPEEFYKAVDEANIAEGLISRLTIIPVPEVEPPYNPNAADYAPPESLVWRIAGIVKRVAQLADTHTCYRVPEAPDAAAFQLAYQKNCQGKVWANRHDATGKIWQRAHIRLLRMGALIAVGVNPDNPMVELSHYEWAKVLIERGANELVSKFKAGEVGQPVNIVEQRSSLRTLLLVYKRKGWDNFSNNRFGISFDMWKVKAVPFSYLYENTRNLAAYRNDRNPAMALTNIVREFESAGYIVKVDAAMLVKWGKRGNVWTVTDSLLTSKLE